MCFRGHLLSKRDLEELQWLTWRKKWLHIQHRVTRSFLLNALFIVDEIVTLFHCLFTLLFSLYFVSSERHYLQLAIRNVFVTETSWQHWSCIWSAIFNVGADLIEESIFIYSTPGSTWGHTAHYPYFQIPQEKTLIFLSSLFNASLFLGFTGHCPPTLHHFCVCICDSLQLWLTHPVIVTHLFCTNLCSASALFCFFLASAYFLKVSTISDVPLLKRVREQVTVGAIRNSTRFVVSLPRISVNSRHKFRHTCHRIFHSVIRKALVTLAITTFDALFCVDLLHHSWCFRYPILVPHTHLLLQRLKIILCSNCPTFRYTLPGSSGTSFSLDYRRRASSGALQFILQLLSEFLMQCS